MEEDGVLVSFAEYVYEYIDTDESRPAEFVKKSSYDDDSEDEESTVGKMPPADDEE